MKKWLGCFVFLLFISGCSTKDVSNSPSNDEALIEQQKSKITRLTEELTTLKKENELLSEKLNDVSPNIQLLDHQSRMIMKLIQDDNLDEIKRTYDVDFTVSNGLIIFEEVEVQPFPVELADLPMYFAFYNPNEDFIEVGYYLYDNEPERERKYLLAFHYDKEKQFRYIVSGDT